MFEYLSASGLAAVALLAIAASLALFVVWNCVIDVYPLRPRVIERAARRIVERYGRRLAEPAKRRLFEEVRGLISGTTSPGRGRR